MRATSPPRVPWVLLSAVLLATAACQQPAPANNTPGVAPGTAASPAAAPAPVAGRGNPGTPVTVNIGLKYKTENGKCIGRLSSDSMYSVSLRRTWKLHWAIDPMSEMDCAGFDYTKACVEFGNREKVVAPFRQCGKAATKAIDAQVTGDPNEADDNSTHLYSIRYDGKAGGDPEVVVICDVCDP